MRVYIPKPKEDMNERILEELEDKEDNEAEDVFDWRKDYTIHDWFCSRFKVENCKELELTKEDLKDFMLFLESLNGKEDTYWAREIYDFAKEISQLKEILEYDEFEEYRYYYWAWW